jgi:hypothetical protein
VNFTKTDFQAEERTMFNGKKYVVRMIKAENNANFSGLSKFLKDFKDPDLPSGSQITAIP